MADALATLRRLRRFESDQARWALGQAVGRETQARDAVQDARAARHEEIAHAVSDAADPLAHAYAAWLPVSAQAIRAAESVVEQTASAAAVARQALASCKAALEAVDLVTAERDLASRRRLDRRVQLRLDELGQGSRRSD